MDYFLFALFLKGVVSFQGKFSFFICNRLYFHFYLQKDIKVTYEMKLKK